MEKLYFQKHDERCYSLDYHKEFMNENNISELELFEAKIERGTDYFFCKHYDEIGEKNETCGKMCEAYKPRNKKSGCCSHVGFLYEQTKNKIVLK